MHERGLSRRAALAGMAALGASPLLGRVLAEDPSQRRFWIGACDWSIGRRGEVEAMARAEKIGLDGLQVSFEEPGEGDDLRQPENRERYAEAARRHGQQIGSLAMGVLNRVPLATQDRAERWVEQCIDVMEKMGQRIVLLAFFGQGDIHEEPELQRKLIERLKRLAPRAEGAGVTLGLESWLSAEQTVRIMDTVGSEAVKMYYDVANSERMDYDIYKEIRWLGSERICEFHMKENNDLLGEGRIDFERVRDAINDIGYTGWLHIEAAVDQDEGIVESYRHNQRYLREVFAA